MIISMRPHATREEIDHVCERIREFGYKVHSIEGEERVVIGVVGIGDVTPCLESLEATPGVERAMAISAPYKFVSREFKPERTVIKVNGVAIGGDEFVMLCGELESHAAVRLIGDRIIRSIEPPRPVPCDRGIRGGRDRLDGLGRVSCRRAGRCGTSPQRLTRPIVCQDQQRPTGPRVGGGPGRPGLVPSGQTRLEVAPVREIALQLIAVNGESNADLVKIGKAGRAVSLLFGAGHRGQQHRGQYGDDGHHDQQFD